MDESFDCYRLKKIKEEVVKFSQWILRFQEYCSVTNGQLPGI